MADFLQILGALLSPAGDVRNPAEKAFEEAKKNEPALTVAGLFQVLAQPQVEEAIREQGAVLLRQCLSKVKDEGSLWSKLAPEAQKQCMAQLLQLLEGEATAKVGRKVADIVQSLGNQLIDIADGPRPNNITQWPELMPSLMRVIMDAGKPAVIRATMLWTVKELQCSIWPVMVANSTQTQGVLSACLSDADVDVRSNAAVLFCEMIDFIQTRQEREPFKPLIDMFLKVLQQISTEADNKNINSVLQSLQGSTELVDFLKDSLGSLVLPFLAAVGKSHKEEDTQRLALEVMITFAESKAKMMSKVQGFFQQTLDVCVTFLTTLDDDIQAWSAETNDDAEDEENYTNGKEVIDRLSRCMAKADKFPQLMEVLKAALEQLFTGTDWKRTVAGITILAQIAEFIEEESTILEMLTIVRAQQRAQHPRVRHAAWSAIAQFSEDHSDIVTNDSIAPQVLAEFLSGLDETNTRVLERCMEAFQHFGETVERELLEPFVQPMMVKLGKLLQSPMLSVQKKAITFIAVIAGQVEDAFAPYYPSLMPLLKQLVQNVLHKTEERVLLGKLFECISLLAKAVGSAGFRTDAEAIMQAMIQATQIPNLPNNDPVKEYMMAASERICSTMKADFLPFLPHILPAILEKLTLAPKEYNPSKDEFGEDEEVNVSLVQDGDKVKVLIMSTSEMEDLQNALSCVHTFAHELNLQYHPFVSQTAQALLPVFDFSMDEDIRDLAFDTWGELCSAARAGGQAGIVNELVKEFMNRILPKLTDYTNLDVQALKTRAEGVSKCLKKAGPNVLSADQVKHINGVAMTSLRDSFERQRVGEADKSKVRQQLAPGEEEENIEDEDDEEAEKGLRIACCEVVGALMQHHADAVVAQQLGDVLQLVHGLLTASSEPDRCLALFIICDMLEHLQQRVTAHWPSFMPQLLQGIVSPSAKVRQPACYGASLAAKDPAFANVAREAATQLAKVVVETRGRTKKKSEKDAQACADNALSALVEILSHHQSALVGAEAELWGVWLRGLPCQQDEQEGKKNHGILVRLAESGKKEILGDGGENLPQVLSVLVDVYKTEMVEDESSKAIGQLIRKIGDAKLEQIAGQLKEKQKAKLLRIYREAA